MKIPGLLFSFLVFLNAVVYSQEIPADFPDITTSVYGETAEGKIFLNVSRDIPDVGFYIMILENDGTPYFYRKLPHYYSYDFKRQPNGYYSYMEYVYPPQDYKAVAKLLDPEFNLADSFLMTEGFLSDSHDFIMLPNGHYFLFTHEPYPVNLEQYGGYPNAKPLGTLIQEFDAEKNLVWQWRFFDHFDISYVPLKRLGNLTPDIIHTNSLEIDNDGNLLVSSINAEFAFKINRQTGEVMWVLGGKKNMFSFTGVDSAKAAGWFDGHSLRRLENGNILYFDNDDRRSDEVSHVCEWKLDEENLTAELVWEYVPDPPVYGPTRGNSNRLPNGNTFIGWGSASDNGGPVCSEVSPEGELLFELRWNNEGLSSYRAHRQPVSNDPRAEWTIYEVRENESLEFIQGDTLSTGVSVKTEEVLPVDYNELQIQVYDYAPFEPLFPGHDPMAYQKRVVMDTKFISTINGEISFDVDIFGIQNPENVTVYFRPFEGQGLFIPLTTTFDQSKKCLTTSFNKPGEFMFGYPDLAPVAFPPLPYQPFMQERWNENVPVVFKWSPKGFFTGFDLQVSRNENFTDLVIDESNIKIPYYEFNFSEGGNFYWKVKASNDAGTGEWSEVFEFTNEKAFIDVLSPNGNENWLKAEEYFITWEDNISEDVLISLFKDNELVSVLDTTESHGAYLWTTPININDYDNYRIEIKSINDSAIVDISSAGFNLFDSYTSDVNSKNERQLSVYPNPASENIYVEYEVNLNVPVRISLYDLQGKKVRELYHGNPGTGRFILRKNIDDLPGGTYFIIMTNGNEQFIRKVIISG